jgi:hypothetical protein
VQGVDAALEVEPADALDRVGGAAQEVGDLSDGAAGVRAQDDQAVAEQLGESVRKRSRSKASNCSSLSWIDFPMATSWQGLPARQALA